MAMGAIRRLLALHVQLYVTGDTGVRRQRCDNGQEFHVLPGGRVEPGETAAEAVGREVREETGLRVSVGELLWVREYHVSPEFRGTGVARALVEELFTRVPNQQIMLSAWDRELYEVWLKLGFSYVPEPGEAPGYRGYFGDMMRPPVEGPS
ncbi:GNAT family N-acetyltransferase [Streptomyces sp. NPDC058409]|uniref:GNAT family N-acetyltransferase n=1 Tax=Streptomyces sp. NPDC058409 TaxID=3346484 RepID=UPI0036468D57